MFYSYNKSLLEVKNYYYLLFLYYICIAIMFAMTRDYAIMTLVLAFGCGNSLIITASPVSSTVC